MINGHTEFRIFCWNIHCLTGPHNGLSSAVNIGGPATFGRITTTIVPARLIQFGLKYNF
jgi:hypothetical protein